ncbi:MAG: hypothetical protein VKO21_01625 [Candidatus Sericytochromatia bacterium]|nr:hypothetical protein [Candidatus Sericytochromatia bacterium]
MALKFGAEEPADLAFLEREGVWAAFSEVEESGDEPHPAGLA